MITFDYFSTTSQSGKNNHAKQIRHNLIFFFNQKQQTNNMEDSLRWSPHTLG